MCARTYLWAPTHVKMLMWRAEDNLQELVLPSPIYVLGIEVRPQTWRQAVPLPAEPSGWSLRHFSLRASSVSLQGIISFSLLVPKRPQVFTCPTLTRIHFSDLNPKNETGPPGSPLSPAVKDCSPLALKPASWARPTALFLLSSPNSVFSAKYLGSSNATVYTEGQTH